MTSLILHILPPLNPVTPAPSPH